MASATNYRLPQGVFPFPHPDAMACNCLNLDWNGFDSIYAFPPVGLIPTLLPLIRGYRGHLVVVAPWDPTAPWLPFLIQHARDHLHLRSANDAVPILRPRPGLPQVGDFRSMDCIPFLRQAFLNSRPAAVVETLIASYRPSSQRQQEVAWAAFCRWLPLDRSTVTKDDVLTFLQYLFSAKSLAPNTIINYRGALQRPLEEAFSINFSHLDFSRFAAGLFHLRPPLAPDVPQWNLSEVLRFYERVDHHSCSPRLLLLKTL